MPLSAAIQKIIDDSKLKFKNRPEATDDVEFIEGGNLPPAEPEFIEMTADDEEHIRRG